MKTVGFPERNIIYTKPATMTDKECTSMEVWENETMKVSCWEATPEEVLHFIFFRKVWLRVFLNIQPPVYLSPEFPFNLKADGTAPEPIEEIVKLMIDRKVAQFLEKRFDERDLNSGIYFSGETEVSEFLKEFTNFFVGKETEIFQS